MNDLNNSQQQKKFKIFLLGDTCIDVYRYGVVERISPEAPVPVFRMTHERTLPGMASNVEVNLQNLGCDVVVLTGDSSKKTRVIDTRSGQHLIRIDDDVFSAPLTIDQIRFKLQDFDAIVFSDYNKGFISYTLISDVRDMYDGPIFVDTKKTDLEYFQGCYVKINAVERAAATSICDNIITTLGGEGAEYKGVIYPAVNTEVVDVCGAGDTFLAALTFSYLNTRNMEKAISFANKASALTVQHSGVYAPKLKEIK
jgi:D-glycero-beta-D-manno-heptose-7-phosphate kinase